MFTANQKTAPSLRSDAYCLGRLRALAPHEREDVPSTKPVKLTQSGFIESS